MRIISLEGLTEHDTLSRLQWDAWQDGSLYYAYVHLKGITHPGDPCVDDWRELLEYWMIDCWRLCRAALDDGHDVVGVNFQETPATHFSGNFFWIKQPAVKLLPDVSVIGNPESWLSQARKPLSWKCLHTSGVNHYQERYPPERYR